MHEVMQGRGAARRRRVKALDQVSARSNDGGFDHGSADIDTDGQRVAGVGACQFFAHNGLCIIPSLCNSTGQYDDGRRRGAEGAAATSACEGNIPEKLNPKPSCAHPARSVKGAKADPCVIHLAKALSPTANKQA